MHLTKFHLERVALVSGRPPHLITSKVIARPLTILLPFRRMEFRPQEFTLNFVIPVTHEMCIQPYLSYCLESNSYTLESNASRLQAYLRGLVFKTKDSFQLLLLNVSSSTVEVYHDNPALQFPASRKTENNESVPRSGIHKYKFEPLYAPMSSNAISNSFITTHRSPE